jgi:hypothetical protein
MYRITRILGQICNFFKGPNVFRTPPSPKVGFWKNDTNPNAPRPARRMKKLGLLGIGSVKERRLNIWTERLD